MAKGTLMVFYKNFSKAFDTLVLGGFNENGDVCLSNHFIFFFFFGLFRAAPMAYESSQARG